MQAAKTPDVMVAEVRNGAPQEPAPDQAKSACPTLAKRILLVDDNHINLKMLSAFMSKLGRAYGAAVNGKEAVDAYLCDPGQYAGIIMDISMPVMDGFEATRRIRQFEAQNQVVPPVAILALTGLASTTAHQEALESGVNVFLTKPVRLKMLSGVLESMEILPPREEGTND
jgi:CheY-like chemotaxis protein